MLKRRVSELLGVGVFCLFGFSFSFVSANLSGEYNKLMDTLDIAHIKVVSAIEEQEKRVDRDFDQLEQLLEKEYAYKSLQCLGIVSIDYTPTDSVKEALFQDLLDFNTKIYSYKIGIIDSAHALEDSLENFIQHDIDVKSKGIYAHFDEYQKNFRDDIRTYLVKNESLILPLVTKMKFLDDTSNEFKALEKISEKARDDLFNDKLLKNISLIKPKIRAMYSATFDKSVQDKLTVNTLSRIAEIKKEYLASFDEDFNDLYSIPLSISLYELDTSELKKFLETYYTDDQYQCSDLVGDTRDFSAMKKRISNQLILEKTKLGTYVNAVESYNAMPKSQKDKLKVKMITSLKRILDEYKGIKLRNALSQI